MNTVLRNRSRNVNKYSRRSLSPTHLFPYEQPVLCLLLFLLLYATSGVGLFTGQAFNEYATLGYIINNQVVDELSWVGTAASVLCTLVALSAFSRKLPLPAPYKAFLAFSTFIAFTGLWSDVLLGTIYVLLKIIVYGTAAIVTASRLTRANLLNTLIASAWVITLISLYISATDELFRVSLGAQGWRGLFVHKNAFGAFAMWVGMLLFPFIYVENSRRIGAIIATLAILLLVIVVSQCKTAAGLLGAYIISGHILMKTQGVSIRRVYIGTCIVWFAFAVTFLPVLADQITSQNITFTGRTRIWAYFLEDFRENPVFGFGGLTIPVDQEYAAVGLKAISWPSPDSSFIIILINTGVIGLSAYAAAIFAFFKHSYDSGSSYAFFALLGVASYLCFGFLESGSQMGFRFPTMFILIQSVLVLRWRRAKLAGPANP